MIQNNLKEINTNHQDIFCLEKSDLQEKLKFSSLFFISIGGILAFFLLFINLISILFFILNDKAKRSPLCIYSFFLSIFNLLKLITEYFVPAMIKLKLIDTENDKNILFTTNTSTKSNDYICKWINFLPTFSGHMGAYLILLLQLQRYLIVKKKLTSLNLLLYNHALTYFICIALILVIFIFDEFYLFDSYFITIIYCPLTMIFTCVINDNFKLLKSISFDTFLYHHIHTIIYNIIPSFLIIFLNLLIFIGIRQRKYQTERRKRTVSSGSGKSSSDESKKRKRLSSTNSTYSPARNYARLVRKKSNLNENLFIKLKEIYLDSNEVTNVCILISFVQILNTFPVNVLSYLTEWSSQTVEKIAEIVSEKTQDLVQINWKIPIKILGDKNNVSQIEIYFFYILSGLFEMLNFNVYLVYQLFSCKCLFLEFEKTILNK